MGDPVIYNRGSNFLSKVLPNETRKIGRSFYTIVSPREPVKI